MSSVHKKCMSSNGPSIRLGRQQRSQVANSAHMRHHTLNILIHVVSWIGSSSDRVRSKTINEDFCTLAFNRKKTKIYTFSIPTKY